MSFHKINKYIFTLQRCSLSKCKCLVIIWFNGRLKKKVYSYIFFFPIIIQVDCFSVSCPVWEISAV